MNSNLHEGHRKRVKDEFVAGGCRIDNMSPHKVLELALFYAIPRKDTNEIAHRLINKFGSINNVLSATIEELTSIEGVAENTAVFLKLINQVARLSLNGQLDQKPLFTSPEQAGDYIMAKFKGEKDELFALVSLNGSGELISFDYLNDGSATSVGINTRKLLETVISRRAVAVILAHNHPGGLALPSGEDIASTKAIVSLLRNVGINVIDHLIICDTDYVSLAQSKEFCDIFR